VTRHKECLEAARQYYSAKLAAHGPTARGVDWNSEESQYLRFVQLLKIAEGHDYFSLIDYGCGYGGLVSFLRQHKRNFFYTGFDIAESMVEAARGLYGEYPYCSFTTNSAELSPADFVVSSGALNVKLDMANQAWEEYVLHTLENFNELSGKGFAFNLLSRYSDPALRRGDLFYADPLGMFDHCKRRFSRLVALLHDYPLYEFTILVRK
jgi:SAM-dependent methyltransferase